jgi:hypothetical protein
MRTGSGSGSGGNSPGNEPAGAGGSNPGPPQYLTQAATPTSHRRHPVRGVQETAGTSILSVGTAAQIRAQRNRFISELSDLIDSDTAAWRANVADVLAMLREELGAERARQGTGPGADAPRRFT